MDRKWTLKRGSKEHGPMSERQLRKLGSVGKLPRDDLLQEVGCSDWKPVASVEGLIREQWAERPPTTTSTKSSGSATRSEDTKASQAASTVPTFGEWYSRQWPSRLMWFLQIPLWMVYGFVWIPIWYFCTATSGGSVVRRWYALPLSGRVIACLRLLLPVMLINSWMRPPSPSKSLASNASDSQPVEKHDVVRDGIAASIATLEGDWIDREGKTRRLVVRKRSSNRSGGLLYKYSDKGAEPNSLGHYPEFTLSEGEQPHTGKFTYSGGGIRMSGDYMLENSSKLTLSGKAKIDGEREELPFFAQWTRRPASREARVEPRPQTDIDDVRVKLAKHAIETIMDGGRSYRELEPRFHRITPEGFEDLMRRANSEAGLGLSRTKLSSALERTEEFETHTGGQAPATVIRYGPNVKVGYGYSLKRGVHVLYYAVIADLEYTPDGVRPH